MDNILFLYRRATLNIRPFGERAGCSGELSNVKVGRTRNGK
jgi:hypothetical protein